MAVSVFRGRLFLSVSDISADSVAEFDSCDYERQQVDNRGNVHGWTSVHIVEPASPLSRWERSAPALRLAISGYRGSRRPVDPVGDSHHAAAALNPSSDEESGEVSRGSYMREMPDPTKPQVKGQKNNLWRDCGERYGNVRERYLSNSCSYLETMPRDDKILTP